MAAIPVTTTLLFSENPRAVSRALALESVAEQEVWLAADPVRSDLEEWFAWAWGSYHDPKKSSEEVNPVRAGRAARSVRSLGIELEARDALLQTCKLLLIAIRVRVEARTD